MLGQVGPANLVTAFRAVLSLVVAVLVVQSYAAPAHLRALVTISAVALALDWVDGQIARRTHTASAFGARFDMEVDAFLILVLSAYAAMAFGAWVLAIGLARYLLLAAERVLPWLHRPSPPRYWAKVVAGLQGVVLVVVAADVLPHALAVLALVAAFALLAESFGRQVWWLWRTRDGGVVDEPFTLPLTLRARARVGVPDAARPRRGRERDVARPAPAGGARAGGAGRRPAASDPQSRGRRRRHGARAGDGRQGPGHGLLLRAEPVLRPGDRLDVRRVALRPAARLAQHRRGGRAARGPALTTSGGAFDIAAIVAGGLL